MAKILIGVLVATVVVIIGFLIIDPAINVTPTNTVTETVDESIIEGLYQYTLEGEVNKPGTYSLKENITMGELITAAGGLTTNSDDLAFFEETVLKASTTYYIASKYNINDTCSNDPIEKVNINTDDADTLMNVNGITSSIASSIVSYRTGNGNFNTLEQLTEVYGIGNATYRKIRNFVILHE
ncbi:MAG: helix-hairpin-helix domain-containing protein [Bacilli bacterium]|nr:helix-hairpin-helix domain-containing protein [Bacilli bacterium]